MVAEVQHYEVGPPKGARPVANQTDMGEQQTEKGGNLASPRRPIRTVGEEAKRHLEQYHE